MANLAAEPPPVRVSRRQVLQLVGGAVAVAVSSHALSEASAASEPPGLDRPADVGAVDERRYRGTATTTLTTDRFTGGTNRQSTQHDVLVAVTPPAEAGPASNPFELRIDVPGGGAAPPGPGRIVTSEVEFDPESGREAVRRHWEIQAGENGVFSGILQDEDAAANVLSSRRELIPGHEETVVLVTEAMAGGSTLVGTITPDRIDIDVSGNVANRFAGDVFDRSRPFVTEVRAVRE